VPNTTPLQDSNPLLFPLNLPSDAALYPAPPHFGDESDPTPKAKATTGNSNDESFSIIPLSPGPTPSGTASKVASVSGPFVSPRSVPRSFQPGPETPSQDSNPLLYPRGLSFYPQAPFADDGPDQDAFDQSQFNSARKIASEPPPSTRSLNQRESSSSSQRHSSTIRQADSTNEIDLSTHDPDEDPDLHAPIDLSQLNPDAVLNEGTKMIRQEKDEDKSNLGQSLPSEAIQRKESINKKASKKLPRKKSSPYPKKKRPKKKQSPEPLPEPQARKASSVSPSQVDESVTNISSISGTTTTSGGLPSETSSCTPVSHSSRFTAAGADPNNYFDLELKKENQVEPSVFTADEEEDHSEALRNDESSTSMADSAQDSDSEDEGAEGDCDSEEVEEDYDSDESDSYEEEEYEMEVVEEESEYEEMEDDDDSNDDSSGIEPLADQEEQYEPLNDVDDENDDEFEELNDLAQRKEYTQSVQHLDSKVQKLPSLVSMASMNSSSTNSSSTSSATLLRVKMCPMEITFVSNGEENSYRGFYSGPINGRGEMHGNGVFWFDTGDLYLGQFYSGNLHGCGVLSLTVEEEIDEETGNVLAWSNETLKGYFKWNEYIGTEPIDVK